MGDGNKQSIYMPHGKCYERERELFLELREHSEGSSLILRNKIGYLN